MPNQLAYDILWTLREVQAASNTHQVDVYADAVARYMLVQLGLSVEEVDEVNKLFFTRFETRSFGDYRIAWERLVGAVKHNDTIKEHIVSALAATSHAQARGGRGSDQQMDFISEFQDLFDMKPSQFQRSLERGVGWAVALEHLAERYSSSEKG